MNLNKQYLFIFSLFVAAVLLFVGTASSPLFPYNVWDDANCFFTVGKSIFSGKVLYRDIFEQKGLYLYVIYGLGGMISKTSFLGPFLLEVTAIAVFLYYMGKIMRYYTGSGSVAVALPLILTLLLTSACFEKGGSAEEFCLPFFMIYICHAVEVFDNKGTGAKWYKYLIDGVVFSVVFWIKFNIALIFMGGYLIYFIYFISRREGKELVRWILLSIGGFVAGSLPCIIYFLIHGALGDLWFGYFYSNLFLYQGIEDWGGHFTYLLDWSIGYIKSNMLVLILTVLGIIGYARRHRTTMKAGRFFLVSMVLLFLIVCVIKPSYVHVYYTLPNILFTVFGCVELAEVFHDRATIPMQHIGVVAVILPLCVLYTFYGSNAKFLLETPKEELAPYEFAQIIKQEDDATVLNYGCLDTGIYTLAEKEPTTKYFCRLNLNNFEEMDQEQRRMVDERKVDFIITLTGTPDEDTSLEGYKQVAYKNQYLTGGSHYHLYKRQ